jgi:hypothetical protein
MRYNVSKRIDKQHRYLYVFDVMLAMETFKCLNIVMIITMSHFIYHKQGGNPTMKTSMPAMIGDRYSIIAYVDPSIFQKIESMRGDVPRSKFIGKLIQKSLA